MATYIKQAPTKEEADEREWQEYKAGRNTMYPNGLTREQFIEMRHRKLEYFNKYGSN